METPKPSKGRRNLYAWTELLSSTAVDSLCSPFFRLRCVYASAPVLLELGRTGDASLTTVSGSWNAIRVSGMFSAALISLTLSALKKLNVIEKICEKPSKLVGSAIHVDEHDSGVLQVVKGAIGATLVAALPALLYQPLLTILHRVSVDMDSATLVESISKAITPIGERSVLRSLFIGYDVVVYSVLLGSFLLATRTALVSRKATGYVIAGNGLGLAAGVLSLVLDNLAFQMSVSRTEDPREMVRLLYTTQGVAWLWRGVLLLGLEHFCVFFINGPRKSLLCNVIFKDVFDALQQEQLEAQLNALRASGMRFKAN